MSLKNDLAEAIIKAMKSKDTKTVSVLRLLSSEIQKTEIDGQTKLDDVGFQKIVGQQVKRLKDSIKDFQSGGRDDLVEDANLELEILDVYLPEQLSEEELKNIVSKVITETGATGTPQMGMVMGQVMKEVQGQADGGQVREIVTAALQSE